MHSDSTSRISTHRLSARLRAAALAALCCAGASAQQPAPKLGRELYRFPLAPRIPEDTEVVELPSGLRYSVLHAGPATSDGGRAPRAGDCVTVHYSAWLEDGRIHDSSVLRNDPLKTWVGKSIAGWNEALSLMTRGARWKLTLPPELCAGAPGALPEVPAGTTLVFELELIDCLFAPEFHPERPEATQTTPSGLKYEILAPGTGSEAPDKNQVLVVDYGLWTTSGTLLDSAARQGALFEVKQAQLEAFWDLKFIPEAFALLRPGARLRFEVPPEQCFGTRANPGLPANSVTVWEFELVHVRAPRVFPEFAFPDEKKSRKTETGLICEVVREGTGPRPSESGKVVADYAIWLVDGHVFDASFEGEKPVRLDLTDPGLLPGIKEALLSMSEGTILRCRVKPDLAYGGRGWPPYIGPYAELIVYLELVSAS